MITRKCDWPKISCLLVTKGGRFDQFVHSVRCFDRQTYPHRELVVVNEGPHEYQSLIADHLHGRSDVNLVFLDGKYRLGGLRNISVALCTGDVFVQWDDDDYCAPGRLAAQYSHLAAHPKADACFLTDQLHYYAHTGEVYWEDWHYHSGGRKPNSVIPGTLMAWQGRFGIRYPSDWARCEDSVVVTRLYQKGDDHVARVGGIGFHHAYSYHGNNVYELAHHMNLTVHRAYPVEHVLLYRDQLCRAIDEIEIPRPVRVMGRDGLAFSYGGLP